VKNQSHSNWESVAGIWQHRPPIVPDPEDIGFFERAAAAATTNNALRALLLGVTGGIATMQWPATVRLTAVDWSAGMIKKAWPRTGLPVDAAVVLADWMAMPLDERSCDVALGDGCYTALGSLDAAVELNRAVARVLEPGGVLALRCFARGEKRASVDEIFDELLAGNETNLGLFRWRLLMTLQGDGVSGVVLDDAWRVWHERVPEPEQYIERFGWFAHEVDHIARYAGQQACYVFPTVDELEAAAPDFELTECDIPTYRCGAHFPRLVFVKRG